MNGTRVARNISAGVVAGIAAWSSYTHMVAVALGVGEAPEVAHVLPLSVDGLLVVASIAMVDDKAAGRSVRWSARVAFTAGIVASLAANVAAAQPTLGARIVAAWPAVALLLTVELLSRAGRRKAADKSADIRKASTQASSPARADTPPDTPPRNRRTPAPRRSAQQVRRAAAALDADGHTRTQIAAALGISERSVQRALADRAA